MKSITPSPAEICDPVNRGCVAAAAYIIGNKWTPQLLYALASGVKRFSALQRELAGVNPRTLSARLDELEHCGIVTKAAFAEVPPRIEYSLTPKGQDLLPILEDMVTWGRKHAPNTEESSLVKASK